MTRIVNRAVTLTTELSALILASALCLACNSEVTESETEIVQEPPAAVVEEPTAPETPAAEAPAATAMANGPIEVVANLGGAEVPAPIDLPQFATRENLMKAMGGAARRVGSANADDARAAAVAIGEYSLAARHPRFPPEGPEYDAFAIDLWRKNQVVQAALSPEGDASSLQLALRAQRDACQACHTAYRIEED